MARAVTVARGLGWPEGRRVASVATVARAAMESVAAEQEAD